MKLSMFMAACLLVGAAEAATGTSNEVRLDFRGMGPWERRVARPTETISYSTAWATNLSALQQGEAKAVVKVNPCLKTPPKYLVVDMSGGRSAARWPISYLDEVPSGGWTDEYKTEKLVLRYIPAGSFIMGGRNTDYPGAVNTNLHMVTLTKPFYIGVFECTQRQWELAMGTRPSWYSNQTCYATRPVEKVSPNDIRGSMSTTNWPACRNVDADSFAGMLRGKTGLIEFDLPTDAQWEYACRAGTTTALNNGKNLTGIAKNSEADAVARYAYNSGWFDNGKKLTSVFTNATTVVGTAKVGSYLPNSWGLYDMHGNVWEYCLDRWVPNLLLTESVDPMGTLLTTASRVVRGGSYVHPNNGKGLVEYVSGYRQEGKTIVQKSHDTGFRICLHSAELPSMGMGQELVNAAGASAADWTPTQTGTYYLTHEVQTNGVTASTIYGAAFQVAGPELKIVANGELVPGVTVAIEGAGDWPVYYTTDGSAPTQSSPRYEGPFTLAAAAQVRAVAISDGSVRSEVASADFTLHDALSVVGAVARPRYPWNGKVDVDVELKGDPEATYLVELEAKDLAGGTNLPVRTVEVAAAPSSSQGAGRDGAPAASGSLTLSPGAYRFTWDAAADIADDFDFARVAVTVKATGSHLLAYPKTLELTVAGYTGTEVLTNVPTLVRLSTNITGFAYSDFATTNGTDLAFFDADEHRLPYEIDEWNTNGESLVWVKLPTLANGTRFTCAYGVQSNNRTIEQSCNPHAVWADYAGVWHMNEDSGTAFDSTEHGLDALPDCGANGNAVTMAQMIAYENGACGRARINSIKLPGNGNNLQNYMVTPAYDGLKLGSHFVISGWCMGIHWHNDTGTSARIVSHKENKVQDAGWEIGDGENVEWIWVSDNAGTGYDFTTPNYSNKWLNFCITMDGNKCECYTNGFFGGVFVVQEVQDNGIGLGFGNTPTGSRWSFVGQYDEIRLRGGSLSADRIKADYDMIANREFLSYGAVRAGCEEAVK